MKIILDRLNNLSRLLLGVGFVDIFRKASWTKKEAQKAEHLAQKKQLPQAVETNREILSRWAPNPSFFERLFRKLAMGNLLEQLKGQLKRWQNQIDKANELAARARNLEGQDQGNPHEIKILSEALRLYQDCNHLIYEPRFIDAATRLEYQLHLRKSFQVLLKQGQQEVKQGFYKQALSTFEEAKNLFLTKEVEEQIEICQSQSQKQDKYETSLIKANQLATEGNFYEASSLLREALTRFSRSDGKKLLNKIEKVIIAKECFCAGLVAEKGSQLDIAKVKYQAALMHLPELTECQTRLGVVALKGNNFSQALSFLKEINGEQAAYLRGLAYAKQKNWQQGEREWRSVRHTNVEKQRQVLRTLAQRDRLVTMKEIESLVDSGSLEQAKLTSLELINKFGADLLVEENLKGHIQAQLEHQIWESQNWGTIATTAEQNWLEKQDITSLHNWAVASYYQAQTDSTKLADLIVAWSTALANLHLDPFLKNVLWLGSTSVNLNEVSSQLKQLLEVSIDAVKDKDIKEYLRLRDLYRREMVALRLMGNSSCGMKINELAITPGCYQKNYLSLPKTTFPAQVWGALYTDWGIAVAACLEGDTARAIQIKPTIHPSSEAERFAYSLMSYHEGCYYLQNHNWRKATTPLKQAKTEIKTRSDWREEIDKLCSKQRQEIDNFEEHLDFAQFWYELLGSQPARSYLAEFKSAQVEEKLAKKTIGTSQAIKELNEIKKIDEHNPVVIDLVKRVEFNQELEKIDQLLKKNQFEEAVRLAKRSNYERIRCIVAEICLEILIKGVESRQLPLEMVHQLGRWAKELCPYEPAFQEIYRSLNL